MTARFYLADPHRDSTSIVLVIRHGNGAKCLLKFGTGISITPNFWNSSSDRVKRNVSESSSINDKLNELEKLVNDSFDEAERILKVDPFSYTKSKLQSWRERTNPIAKAKAIAIAKIASETESRKSDLIKITEDFLAIRGNELTLSSKQKYKQLLKDFQSIFGLSYPVQNFSDPRNLDKFSEYWLQKRSMAHNTIARKYKFVKTVMLWAQKRGYDIPPAVLHIKCPVSSNDADVIALSEAELNSIESLQNLSKTLENARRCFLALCYTGCRHSDLGQIRIENVQDGLLTIHQQKTASVVAIPMHKRLERLLTLTFHPVNSVFLSKRAKEIGKLAGIDVLCTIRQKKGNKNEEITKPKYEFISTHTGRRTFITFMLTKSVPQHAVMKLSGHKDVKSFQKYIKFSQDFLSNAVNNAWGE